MTLTLLALALMAPNLVPNSDFRGELEGWRLPAQVELATDTGRGDARSLRLHNLDPAAYPLASLTLPLEPGRTYRFSAWVKTEGVTGDDLGGATVCLQSHGPDGYLGGKFPSGAMGDTDWFQVSAEYDIPAAATSSALSLYLRRGVTGTAWFDDVEVSLVEEAPLRASMIQPNYRGWLRPEGDTIVAYRLGRELPGGVSPAECTLSFALRDGEQVVGTSTWAGPLAETGWATTSLRPDTPGSYELEVILSRTDGGTELGRWSHPLILRAPDAPVPAVAIDAQGFCVVAGERFFPLGLYMSDVDEASAAQLAAAGFNTMMPYAGTGGGPARITERLDTAEAAGMKLILSIKDLYAGTRWAPREVDSEAMADEWALSHVNAYKHHPGLLAWYTNDELPLSRYDQLVQRQRLIAEADPDHPTWAVLYQIEVIDRYAGTADVLGTDPYPIPERLPSLAADWTRRTLDARGPNSPIWQVPQIFDWAGYREGPAKDAARPPTLDEMRTMAYQCLVEGAKGLIFYSWYDLHKFPETFDARWAEVTQMNAELRAFLPWVIADQTSGWSVESPSADAVGRVWGPATAGGPNLLLVTNGGDEEVTLTLAGPVPSLGAPLYGQAQIAGRQLTLAPRSCAAYPLEAG